MTVDDNKAAVENTARPKADPGDSSQVGAPMSGVVVEIRVHDGGEVKKGDPIAVLSAMKMVSNFNLRLLYFSDGVCRKWSSQRPTLVRLAVSRSRKVTRWEAQTSFVRLSNQVRSKFKGL